MESRWNKMVIGKDNKVLDVLKKIANFCLDIIFPIECLGCKKEGKWLCEDCFKGLKIQKNLSCSVCKLNKEDFFLDRILSAAVYDENRLLKKAIHWFKYKYVSGLSKYLGKFLVDYLEKVVCLPESSIIIPVPLHKKRFCQRGFNQAELIAKIVGDSFSIKVVDNVLVRYRYTKPQVGLDEKVRSINVKGAFKVKRKDYSLGKNIILVDDVFTTGATLNECAKVLKSAGAKEIWGVTVARG